MRRAQVVVHVPASLRGVGDRQFEVERTEINVSAATLPGLREEYVNNRAGLKAFVLRNIGTQVDNDGKLIVYEGSDVIYTLLDEEWRISELNYQPTTGESVVTLNASLRGLPMLWGNSSRHQWAVRLRGARQVYGPS